MSSDGGILLGIILYFSHVRYSFFLFINVRIMLVAIGYRHTIAAVADNRLAAVTTAATVQAYLAESKHESQK